MLPHFPHLAPLQLEHRRIIAEFTKNNDPSSDYNFASLWSWDIDHTTRVATLNGNLVVQFSDYLTHEPFLSFFGKNQLGATIDTLLDYSKTRGLSPKLQLVPEFVVDALPQEVAERYEITEDRDNFDYILSAAKLADPAQFTMKRRQKHHLFMRQYGQKVTCKLLDLTSPSTLADIHRVFDAWQQGRRKTDADVQDERAATERCVRAATELNIEGFGVYNDGQLIAFLLFDLAHGGVANAHFEKANMDYRGVLEFLKYELAKHLLAKKVEFIDLEQDLGILGLRQSKESYRPIKLLKKYSIAAA